MKPTALALVTALIERTVPFAIAEVRGYAPDLVEYIDKKTGKQASFSRILLNCEAMGQKATPFIVSVDLPKGATISKDEATKEVTMRNEKGIEIPPLYKKGVTVLFQISHYEIDKGVNKARAVAHQPIDI